MSIIFIFYILAILIIAGLVYGSYKLLKQRNKLIAIFVSLVILVILILNFPFPIRHEFITFGEIIYHEIEDEISLRQESKKKEKMQHFKKYIYDRFAGPLDFSIIEHLVTHWHRVSVNGNNAKAYYDADSGMFFSEWFRIDNPEMLLPLNIAQSFCRNLSPVGYWSLITEAENYLIWKSEGSKTFLSVPASTVSQLIDTDMRLIMPTYKLINSEASNSQQQSATVSNSQQQSAKKC